MDFFCNFAGTNPVANSRGACLQGLNAELKKENKKFKNANNIGNKKWKLSYSNWILQNTNKNSSN